MVEELCFCFAKIFRCCSCCCNEWTRFYI